MFSFMNKLSNEAADLLKRMLAKKPGGAICVFAGTQDAKGLEELEKLGLAAEIRWGQYGATAIARSK